MKLLCTELTNPITLDCIKILPRENEIEFDEFLSKNPNERAMGMRDVALRMYNNLPKEIDHLYDVAKHILRDTRRLDIKSWTPIGGEECGTAMCIGGWAILLAGEVGLNLMREMGDHDIAAGILIPHAANLFSSTNNEEPIQWLTKYVELYEAVYQVD